jgi:hypothetical protein
MARRSSRETNISFTWSRNSTLFKNQEDSLQCSQKHTSDSYPKTDKSIPLQYCWDSQSGDYEDNYLSETLLLGLLFDPEQYFPPKRQWISIGLHAITSQKTVIKILILSSHVRLDLPSSLFRFSKILCENMISEYRALIWKCSRDAP